MAEIYTSSEVASLGRLSQDATDHINSVLADLGLTGTNAVAVQTDGAGLEVEAGDVAAVVIPVAESAAMVDVGSEPVAVILAGSGSATLHGSGEADVWASGAGNAITAGAGDATIRGGAGADSLSGGTEGGRHTLIAVGAGDTLAGGLGMDTLWGSDTGASLLVGGANGRTEMHAGQNGGDTIRSSGGLDTIYGGNATIYASGHSATVHVDGDTVRASGDGATIDGSASTHAIHVESTGAFATILGGSGNDTIMLHDAPAGGNYAAGGAGEDHFTASLGGRDTLDGGAGDDGFLSYGLSDSVIGGDGSDHFTIAGFGLGMDTLDGGAGDDTAWFRDRSFADAQIAHSGTTTLVTFQDGYGASLTGIEHLQFKDTVLAG